MCVVTYLLASYVCKDCINRRNFSKGVSPCSDL